MQLIARLRPDHPLGAARLTCDVSARTFCLEGVGEIAAAKLLDLESRKELVWQVGDATREQLLALASARARIQSDREAARQTRVAHAAATLAGSVTDAAGERPGVPPRPVTFEAPSAAPDGGARIVWSEPAAAEARPVSASGQAPSCSRRPSLVMAIVAIVCVAAITFGFLSLTRVVHWPTASQAAQSDDYTALYFTSPATLPTTLVAHAPNLIRFTVFNHEGRARTYDYTVTLAGPGTSLASRVIGRGSMGVRANTGAVGMVRVVPAGRHGTYKITVAIANPQQKIYFNVQW